jgi:hypothetical protein
MDIRELIVGSFEDYWARFDRAIEGLTSEELAWQPQPECNPISFIAWHMARVEDRFIQHFAKGKKELWVTNEWYTRFRLQPTDHGVHFTMDQVLTFPAISPDMLAGYLGDVRRATKAFLLELQLDDLDNVPGRPVFPPNTPRESDKWPMGRMFRQMFGELNQHLGQVDYIRGMIKGFGARISINSPLRLS